MFWAEIIVLSFFSKFSKRCIYLENNLVFLYNQKALCYTFEHHYDYVHYYLSIILFYYIPNYFNDFLVDMWDSYKFSIIFLFSL